MDFDVNLEGKGTDIKVNVEECVSRGSKGDTYMMCDGICGEKV